MNWHERIHIHTYIYTYCGVFTPCKNCNIETRSRDYATVDEAVFSPCRAESRSYKHLDNARVGKGHVTASVVTQQLKRFPACQIKVRSWRRADRVN
jgi:hypothetical protein